MAAAAIGPQHPFFPALVVGPDYATGAIENLRRHNHRSEIGWALMPAGSSQGASIKRREKSMTMLQDKIVIVTGASSGIGGKEPGDRTADAGGGAGDDHDLVLQHGHGLFPSLD